MKYLLILVSVSLLIARLPVDGVDTLRGRLSYPSTFPDGGDNQGGVATPAGKYANTPVVSLVGLNPYTGNATRVVNDIAVSTVGEVGLKWTRINNTRSLGATNQYFGTLGNWRHSFQWDFTYTKGTYYMTTDPYGVQHPTPTNDGTGGKGNIVLVYPDGTTNSFIETGLFTGIFTCSASQVTDYIVVDGASNVSNLASYNNNYTSFRLCNANNQGYRFGVKNATYGYYTLDSITDSVGQVTDLHYTQMTSTNFALDKITAPDGHYLSIQYTIVPNSNIPSGNFDYINYFNITSVTSSDNRTVSYGYDTSTYPGTYSSGLHSYSCNYYNYDVGTASYPDQTAAIYSYQLNDSNNPQNGGNLATAQDTRASGVPSIKYNFWTPQSNTTAPPAGCVQSVSENSNPSTPHLIVQSQLVQSENNPDAPVVVYTDQTGYGYHISPGSGGLLQQTQNIVDSTNSLSYSSVAGAVNAGDASYDYATSSGTFTTTSQNSNGNNLAATRSVLGRMLSRTWPKVGTEASNPQETWAYNNAGYLTSYTDTLNHTTTITRDSTTNLIQKIQYPDQTFETFTYGSFNEVATHVRRNGGTEVYSYYTAADYGGNYNGMLKSFQDASGGVTSYVYDANYRVASSTDPDNRTTSFLYNDRGQVTTVTTPAGTTRKFGYDNFGNLTSVTNELNKSQTYSYDAFNRLLTATDPITRQTSYAYDPTTPANTKPITIIYPSGKKTAYSYTVNWGYKVSSMITGAGSSMPATTQYSYDLDGNVTTITDPNTFVTTLSYDARDRLASAQDALLNQSTFVYDDASDLVTQQTPDGTTTNVYDSMNRVKQVTDPKGQVTHMTYDPEGSLASYQDPSTNTYNYTYDLDERQLTMQYPDTTQEIYSYDSAGNLSSYHTRDGKVETIGIDQLEREQSSSWNDGVTPSATFGYDNANRVTNVSNGNSSITYGYDDAGETTSETQNISGLGSSKSVSYTYTSDGQLNTLTYPDSTVLTYGYDARNNLSTIQQGSNTIVTYTYDAAGNRLTKNLANGVNSTLSYDNVQRLKSLSDVSPAPTAGSQLQQFSYGYDGMSRRKYAKKAGGLGDAYTYDTSGQLTQVLYGATNPDTNPTNPQRTVNYTFDASGNRTTLSDKLSQEATAFTLNYSPNADNQYTNVGGASLTYDGRGNLATYQEHGATQTHTVTCTYDAENRLLSANNNFDTTNLVQAYDPLGRCVKRIENGVTTYFVYDLEWNVIAEYTSNGVQQARYIDGTETDEVLTKTDSTGNVLYYHTDGLGSVTKLTNSTGAVVESYAYDVYGNPSITNAQGTPMWQSAVGNRFLFTGREYLYSLGVYDYRTRIYDPYLGRFWQPDPIGHGGDGYNVNRYCGNDPINFDDPFGTYWQTIGVQVIGYGEGSSFISDPGPNIQTSFWIPDPVSSFNSSLFAPTPLYSQSPLYDRIYAKQLEAQRIAQVTEIFGLNSNFGGFESNGSYEITSFSGYVKGALQEGANILVGFANSLAIGGNAENGNYDSPTIPTPYGSSTDQNINAGQESLRLVSLAVPLGRVLPMGAGGTLTLAERDTIQGIATKYDTTIDVVGSRAAGLGRNIETDLPIGKGANFRSDIDFRIDGDHPQVLEILKELNKVGGGAGSASTRYSTTTRATRAPYIRFTPKQ